MSEQLNFDQIIRNTNEGHLSCALLLDTSGSMDGAAIRNLNSAIKQFKQDVCSDPDARNRVDVALVTFNSEVKVINDFCPVTERALAAYEAACKKVAECESSVLKEELRTLLA